MTYLYHWVPKNMQGDVLYSLNVLKEKHPNLYEYYANIYEGREHVMEQFIPTLGCLWNDVLHLSAVHPQAIRGALVEAGMKSDIKWRAFEIDPHDLDPEKTSVYLNASLDQDRMKRDNFAPFEPDNLEQYAVLSQETKDYYKKVYDQGGQPLAFHKVVHVLYRGSLDTKGLKIIEV